MVGYIDETGIHSEVRLRYDVALDDKTPDRAEFFYAKCGCYRAAKADLNAPGPGSNAPKSINFQQLYFYGEYALKPGVSLFTHLPVRWVQAKLATDFPDAAGISDMQVGLKYAPLVSERRSLTLQFKATLPSGDPSRGLGTNHASVEPSLLYSESLSQRLTLEAQLGDTLPLSSSSNAGTGATTSQFAGDVLFYGIGPSYELIRQNQFHLFGVVEIVGWNVRSGLVTGQANPSSAGVNIVNSKVGMRLFAGPRHSVYAGYGVALTAATWYRDIFRMEYRYAF